LVRPSRRRLQWLFGAFSAAIIAVLAGLTAQQLADERRQALIDMARNAETLARAVEHHTAQTIGEADLVLRMVSDALAGEASELRPPRLDMLLGDLPGVAPQLRELKLVDAGGRVWLRTGGGPLDAPGGGEAYLGAHDGATAEDGPHVGHPEGEGGGIAVSRALADEAGTPRGVAVAIVDPGYFLAFHRSLDTGRGDSIAILHADASVLVASRMDAEARSAPLRLGGRSAEEPAELGRGAVGEVLVVEDPSGDRLLAHRRVDGLPLSVVVSYGLREGLAEWRRAAVHRGSTVAFTAAVIVAFCAVMNRALGREDTLETTLWANESRFRAVFEQAPIAMATFGPDGRPIDVNERFARLLGYEPAELRDKPFDELIHPGDREHSRRDFEELLSGRRGHAAIEERYLHRRGELIWAHRASASFSDAVHKVALAAMIVDVTQQKRQTEHIRLLGSAVAAAANAIFITDAEARILFANTAFEHMSGYAAEEVIGLTMRVLGPEGAGDGAKAQWATLRAGRVWTDEVRQVRKDGTAYLVRQTITPIRDESGLISHYITIQEDITERRLAEERIQFQAYHDPLTGLANRTLFLERLEQELRTAERHGRGVAILFFDLDQFKQVNDTLGHEAGDALLKQVAARIERLLRRGDTLARLGGDEFAVLTRLEGRTDETARLAERIGEALAAPLEVEGTEVFTSTSVGIAVGPCDAASPAGLLKAADMAMYRAKESGRSTYRFFDGDMQQRAIERMQIGLDLRHAVARDELRLVYQPQFDLRSGRMIGAEALLRWDHPERGTIPTARFIEIAEENGAILPIGAWVLEQACRQLQAWRRAGLTPPPMSINVSIGQFLRQDMVQAVGVLIDETGVPPEDLELEITESLLGNDRDSILRQLEAIAARGVRFAIDDFGTGYSSLSYLRNYPVTRLKIAQQFVLTAPDDPRNAALVRSIISMARALGLEAIAEGVESERHVRLLTEAGCEQGQGYHFSRALDADGLAGMLRRHGGHLRRPVARV
jgi:diguanylate cyclase (GGDEF)-like protein/PAS domain S-box-containing protein